MEKLRTMKPNEWDEVGQLIFTATNTWYEQNGKAAVFNCSPGDLSFFCKTYEDLDPDCCLVIEINGKISASCFYHPRPTHYSLGIMCVHPDYYGRGLARKLLTKIISLSKKAVKPLNLISSAQNIDSFSLYNKAGFVPLDVYLDMILPVPNSGFEFSEEQLSGIRPATFKDIPAMVLLEKEIHGQDHGKDLQYIINGSSVHWNCHVLEKDGNIQGFLCSVNHSSSKIIGLGAIYDSSDTLRLIKSHLNYFKGHSPLLLIPAREKLLVQELLKMKARNIELHITQVLSDTQATPVNGLTIPTFLPE
ncbi:MAG: GNAT family N-acetyltransferase [Lentisphaeraceae bacterium]|nr:GNAT family N-acetyltransferase [Lentisphaeraceae bacterium]